MREKVEEVKPAAVMVVVQVAFAGVNILYKLAANDGMSLKVIVAYRFLFATAFMVPLAVALEEEAAQIPVVDPGACVPLWPVWVNC
ncbi:unnamed protein product [Linum tenue]|uniref:WAT1-related protein n=1 Tax=Linum tenue TaxID=586396 RepID=A0AAV0GRM6_9ROSI|nr:unnamed protein product [Linum tenue]